MDFSDAEKIMCKRFSVEQLTDNRRTSIISVMKEQDVFVGTKTRSGKSSMYHCAPVAMNKTSVTLVIAPLVGIMTV